MKVVILAGGLGTRISEESQTRPKPMVEIGDKPILVHIMDIYNNQGFNDFVICLGYKGYCIKEYFANYSLHNSDVTFDFRSGENRSIVTQRTLESWKVSLVDTGLNTMTAGRIKRISPWLENKPFLLTYGDGLADVDINKLLDFHRRHGKLVTVTAVRPVSRFGAMNVDQATNKVLDFAEKPPEIDSWVNGGFFVCEPEALKYINSDSDILELQVLPQLAAMGQLVAYKHEGFWYPMDSLRDKHTLEQLWQEGDPPWIKTKFNLASAVGS
jgi:glucose-1-phosphate cytidylyltransferase